MNYDTFQLTDNGIIPLDYHQPSHFIHQKDAAILLNDLFVKQYRKTYGEVIGVILHSITGEKLPSCDCNNKGLLGILCV